MTDKPKLRVVSSTPSPAKPVESSIWRDRDMWGGLAAMLAVAAALVWSMM